MSRQIAPIFFAALLVAGIVVGFVGRETSAPQDGPPEVFAFFDEEAEAEYYNEQATRQNLNHGLVIGLITVGVVGLVVVFGGRMNVAEAEAV